MRFILFILFAVCQAELVELNPDRKIFLDCKGEGTPSVVFISGRTDRGDIWEKVFPTISKLTHSCVYDRPGTVTIIGKKVHISRSTSVAQPTTPLDGVYDLHAILANVPKPYILVAHSYGGLIARLYASLYPNEVVGLVLVDTLTEFLYDKLTPSQQQLWLKLNSNYSIDLDMFLIQERTDLVKSFDQLRKAKPLNPLPSVVLTSDEPYDFKSLIEQGILPNDAPVDFGPLLFQAHLDGQKRLVQLLNAKAITETHAGHYIQTEQPQLVIDAIKEVLTKTKKGEQ